MIIELDLDFMAEHGLDAEQYLILYVLHMDERKRQAHSGSGSLPIADMYKYTENVRKIPDDSIAELIAKGFLTKKGNRNQPDMLEVTPKFHKAVFTSLSDWEQLFDLYPNEMRGDNGKVYLLKGLDMPPEEMAKYYSRAVNTKAKHKKVIEITQWAAEKGLIKVGIKKYVFSRLWNFLADKYNINDDVDYDLETSI